MTDIAAANTERVERKASISVNYEDNYKQGDDDDLIEGPHLPSIEVVAAAAEFAACIGENSPAK